MLSFRSILLAAAFAMATMASAIPAAPLTPNFLGVSGGAHGSDPSLDGGLDGIPVNDGLGDGLDGNLVGVPGDGLGRNYDVRPISGHGGGSKAPTRGNLAGKIVRGSNIKAVHRRLRGGFACPAAPAGLPTKRCR